MSQETEIETVEIEGKKYAVADLNQEVIGMVIECQELEQLIAQSEQAMQTAVKNGRRASICREVVYDMLVDAVAEVPEYVEPTKPKAKARARKGAE